MNETVFIEFLRLICAKSDDLNEFIPWHIMHSVQMHLSGSNYDVILGFCCSKISASYRVLIASAVRD